MLDISLKKIVFANGISPFFGLKLVRSFTQWLRFKVYYQGCTHRTITQYIIGHQTILISNTDCDWKWIEIIFFATVLQKNDFWETAILIVVLLITLNY